MGNDAELDARDIYAREQERGDVRDDEPVTPSTEQGRRWTPWICECGCVTNRKPTLSCAECRHYGPWTETEVTPAADLDLAVEALERTTQHLENCVNDPTCLTTGQERRAAEDARSTLAQLRGGDDG